MELKVTCDCGQKYKFDVVPMEGQMPFTVSCPVCGVDGTPLANQLLTQHIASAPPPPVPKVPQAPTGPGGLRINRPAPAAAAPPLFASSPAVAPLPGAKPLASIKPMMKKPIDAPKEFSMGLGILGAFLGSAVGGAMVYGFFLWAHFRIPLTGTIIGVLAGFGARVLARGTDTVLGAIAAVFALFSIVGAFFLIYGELFMVGLVLGIISIIVCVGSAYRIASG